MRLEGGDVTGPSCRDAGEGLMGEHRRQRRASFRTVAVVADGVTMACPDPY